MDFFSVETYDTDTQGYLRVKKVEKVLTLLLLLVC